MAVTVRAEPYSRRRFAAWAIGPWVLLLLAGLGCVQYLRHAEYAYLLAALVVVVVCAGCILRRPWARPAMRVLAVVLAAWALVSGALMLSQWHEFADARRHAMTQPVLAQAAVWMIDRAQRTWVALFALKGIAIPLLFWLEHQLGRPAVRLQFRHPR
jgi:hypothetical protein